MKRALFDGVGQGLKWLFGVATNSDLMAINDQVESLTRTQEDVVHLMSRQASLVNETLWEVRQNTLILSNLSQAMAHLDTHMMQLFGDAEHLYRTSINGITLFLSVENVFNDIDVVLRDWEFQLSELDIGLGVLASGRLPPTIFHSSELRKVLGKVSDRLPSGWSLTTGSRLDDNLWAAYHDAVVSIATTNGQLRAFIRLPI